VTYFAGNKTMDCDSLVKKRYCARLNKTSQCAMVINLEDCSMDTSKNEDKRISKEQWLPKPRFRRSGRPRVTTQHIG